MDREMAERHLALVQEHVASGKISIARQKALITRIAAQGRCTVHAEDVLASFEHLQAMHIAHQERLIEELNR